MVDEIALAARPEAVAGARGANFLGTS